MSLLPAHRKDFARLLHFQAHLAHVPFEQFNQFASCRRHQHTDSNSYQRYMDYQRVRNDYYRYYGSSDCNGFDGYIGGYYGTSGYRKINHHRRWRDTGGGRRCWPAGAIPPPSPRNADCDFEELKGDKKVVRRWRR